jgi:hypothetical protein
MTIRDLKLKRYLGDGVYVGYERDSDQVYLWTSNGVMVSVSIALDRDVRVALSKYFVDFVKFRDKPQREI